MAKGVVQWTRLENVTPSSDKGMDGEVSGVGVILPLAVAKLDPGNGWKWVDLWPD
jgi:hypothetical protein